MKKFKKGLRLGRPVKDLHSDLGPLSELAGTWVGNKGLNIVSVPDFDPSNSSHFKLLARDYIEQITFTPVQSLVPNRKSDGPTEHIAALLYHLTICDKETLETMHVENGMWLHLIGSDKNSCIVRQTSVPHGNVFCAVGGWETSDKPEFQIMNPAPDGHPVGTPANGYADEIMSLGLLEPPKNNIAYLNSGIKNQTILNTTTLSVSTDSELGGGVVSIPFINKNVPTPSFAANYYIEEVQNEDGGTFMQLQYTQNTSIRFLGRAADKEGKKPLLGGELILWPHINVNTLRKV